MMKCSDCYWSEQCARLTNVACDDYTPLVEDTSAEEAAYLANVRAISMIYETTEPDFIDVGSVLYKLSGDSTQCLHI